MADEWGPWVEHDGSGVPNCVLGAYVQILSGPVGGPHECCEGVHPVNPTLQQVVHWSGGGQDAHGFFYAPVIRYRIRKPRGMAVLKALLADLPEKVDA